MIERKSVCKPSKSYSQYVNIVIAHACYLDALESAGPKALKRFADVSGFKVSELPVTTKKRKKK